MNEERSKVTEDLRGVERANLAYASRIRTDIEAATNDTARQQLELIEEGYLYTAGLARTEYEALS